MSVDCPTGPLPALPSLPGRASLTSPLAGAAAERRDRAGEFTAYVEARYDRLLRLATLLAGDGHRGEELLQSALVKTYEAYGRIEDTSRLDAYVRTVMVNALRSRWRRRWREDSYADVPEAVIGGDDMARLAVGDQLRRALLLLPPRQRAALVLRFYDDLSEADTARVLECSVGTIKSQTSRALARLRLIVNEETGPVQVVR